MKSFLLGLATSVIAAVCVGMLVIFGGIFPVSAMQPESELVSWLLHTTYESSVSTQANRISGPEQLAEKSQVLAGAVGFQEMCSGCHTPPGDTATVVSRGLNPPAPELTALMARRTPGEAFWVIKHGVRMTGMPSFGLTHDDVEIWPLVSFLDRAGSLDQAGYRQLLGEARALKTGDDGHEHKHMDEEPSPEVAHEPTAEAPAGVATEGHGEHQH